MMTTPNLDATQHCWVESLVGFTFSIEYHKGWDYAASTMGTIGRAEAHDPVVVEADEEIHKQVWETAVKARAAHPCVNLHLID